jgi:hypothetical protein
MNTLRKQGFKNIIKDVCWNIVKHEGIKDIPKLFKKLFSLFYADPNKNLNKRLKIDIALRALIIMNHVLDVPYNSLIVELVWVLVSLLFVLLIFYLFVTFDSINLIFLFSLKVILIERIDSISGIYFLLLRAQHLRLSDCHLYSL